MKIGFVCSNYLPFLGGVEIHAQQVAQALSERHEVVLAAMNFSACRLPSRLGVLHGNLCAPPAADRREGPINVYSLSPGLPDRILMLPLALRAAPRLQRWFYHEIHRLTHPFYAAAIGRKMRRALTGCDVIHGLVHGDIGWAAERVARSLGIPFICTPFVHPGQWGDGPNDIAYYRRADAVIGLVESDRAYLEALGVPAAKLHVIGVSPNLSPTADGSAFRQAHHLSNNPVVLYVGRMMRQKGAPAILEAAPEVWRQCPKARFLFIGPATPEEQASFVGRDPRIQYLGKVSLQEKADALAACDVFCLPSLSEILPTVYLEAWSFGKPVVGGLAHGLPALVEGHRAGICSAQEPAALSHAISRLLGDPGLRAEFGANGRELVRREYAVESVVGKLEALYSSLSLREATGALQEATA